MDVGYLCSKHTICSASNDFAEFFAPESFISQLFRLHSIYIFHFYAEYGVSISNLILVRLEMTVQLMIASKIDFTHVKNIHTDSHCFIKSHTHIYGMKYTKNRNININSNEHLRECD